MTTLSPDHVVERVLSRAADDDPDAAFVTFGTSGPTLTRASVVQRAACIATGLRGLGVESGERVGVMLTNRYEFVEVLFATVHAGAIIVPLNVSLRGDSLAYVLTQTEPRVIVTERAHLSTVQAALRASMEITIVCVDAADDPCHPVIPYAALAESPPSGAATSRPWDPFAVMYTSGTTGPSKGVVWSHQTVLRIAEVAAERMGYRSDDVLFTALPLFHGNGLALSIMGALAARARVAVMPGFSARRFWHDVVESDATTANLLGSMAQILLRQPPTDLDRAHRLRIALVIPSPAPDLYNVFEERFRLQMVEAYGLTDAGMILWTPAGERRPGSCGCVAPGWDCRLVDNDDVPVKRGAVGELVARPTEPYLAPLGYWRMPEATVEAWRNLWIHTGDLFREQDGWFTYVGRSKDAIRRRGENVSAFEVERALLSHAAVEECVAYGVPSEVGEEDVMVAVVVADVEAEPTPEDLLRHCERALPYFAVPRYVRMVDQLPRTETEKVRKGDLVAEGVTTDTWDREGAGYRLTR